MQTGKILLGTLGYAAVTFPLAYIWHLVAFKSTYESLGYFSREEPILVLGFASILIQGVLLSLIYPRLCSGTSVLGGATTLFLVMGGYHWSMHVVAEAAKHKIEPLPTWFALETLYLCIQFGLGGLLLSLIYRKPDSLSGEQ